MAEQNKHSYFKQIAGKRVERILEALDALGNCSSPVTYAYDNQETAAHLCGNYRKADGNPPAAAYPQPLQRHPVPAAAP